MKTEIVQLTKPTAQFVEVLNRWENDRELIPLIRPNKSQEELDRREAITFEGVRDRLEYQNIFKIFVNHEMIGEMNYMVDPPHLFKHEPGTAWIGITIGEPEGRGKGIGFEAIQYLEEHIYQQGFNR
ncbi:GNAT family N-acetyltransferase, partial [Staphylococcus sp. SIMBA_130]